MYMMGACLANLPANLPKQFLLLKLLASHGVYGPARLLAIIAAICLLAIIAAIWVLVAWIDDINLLLPPFPLAAVPHLPRCLPSSAPVTTSTPPAAMIASIPL